MVSIRRVPPGRSLPSWMWAGGSTTSRTSSPSCCPSLRLSDSRAVWTCLRRSPMAIESLSSTTISATSAIGLRCSSIRAGLASAASTTTIEPSRQIVPRAPARRPSSTSTRPMPHRTAITDHGTSGSKATETADVGFIVSAFA